MAHQTTTLLRPHKEHSIRLMAQAKEELAAGDPWQAAEKAWGAFSHALKALADERHWEYEDHGQVRPIVNALVAESNDPQLRYEAGIAHHLHTNYYRDSYTLEEIARDHIDVESGLSKLEAISRRYREDAEYRRRADALRPPNSRFDRWRQRWERIPTEANGGGGNGDAGTGDSGFPIG